ncbi:hypothetical protein [uncultured Tateyamaria sp.]|uniref:hypothetical protein n=1 Tax=uncultured Tateyamaria sp. TaxID=455651 RepID=UPI00262CAF0E|nr:hypothetical protein [uncultured Tateyamaria sp.]
MDDTQRWIVTVEPSADLADLSQRLQSQGCAVEHALEELGMLVGVCSQTMADSIAALPEVKDVSPEISTSIDPPDLDDAP